MNDRELVDYRREYPLSPAWGEPTVVRHVTRIGAAAIHLVGLACTNSTGRCVTGSAGQLVGFPFGRAYFELLERTTQVEAAGAQEALVQVRDRSGRCLGTLRSDQVFPQTVDEPQWRYAHSSGVAVGADWTTAAQCAELELVERDRVLRSWYGGIPPSRIPFPEASLPGPLTEHYALECYSFREVGSEQASAAVVGIFGFPRHCAAPLIFGFGARENEAAATVTAASECLQRLGFLWGESIPDILPPFAPTPDYHQEYFLHPPHHAALKAWLGGAHCRYAGILAATRTAPAVRRFADLTPATLRSKLAVVKALPTGELPLTFGRGHPSLQGTLPERLAIHPIP